MKAAFFHDAPLVQGTDGKIYSIGFTYNIWKRYLAVFDFLVVSTRMRYDDSFNGSGTKNLKLSSGERVEFKPISNYQKKMDTVFNKKKIVFQIRETLQQTDYAIIRLPSIIGQIACEEAEKMGKPYLIEVVGCPWDALWNHSSIGKLIAFPSYLAMKKALKNTKYAIYVTSEFLQKRYPTKGKSTNCSNVFLDEFDERILEDRLNRINNMNLEGKVVIGTTGAVDVRYKGQESVIKALGKLKEQGITNYEYQLVGGGEQLYLSSIAKEYDVTEQVKFLGVMPHEKVLNWLASIDIYVQPSKTEGLPRALIEAMSRGLLAIGSNAGGIPELLDEKYIFSKTGKNEVEIMNILRNINKNELLVKAQKNYKLSREYDKNLIDARRLAFFRKFISQN